MSGFGWKAHIVQDVSTLRTVLHVYRISPFNRGMDYLTVVDGVWRTRFVPEGGMFGEPVTLELPSAEMGVAAAIAQAFVDAGYVPKTPKEERLAGEIEATKRHLEDMRHIVFNGKGKP